jgi:hypothetical protein
MYVLLKKLILEKIKEVTLTENEDENEEGIINP